MSRYYVFLNPQALVRDVILHEIAHALVGCEENHNKIWKNMFLDLGGSGTVRYQKALRPPRKFYGICKGNKYWSGCRCPFFTNRRFPLCNNCPKIFPLSKDGISEINWQTNPEWVSFCLRLG